MPFHLSFVHNFAGRVFYMIIFSIHLMLAEILHFNWPESSKAGMKRYFCKADTFNFKTLDQLNAEVKSGGRRGYSPFVFRVDGLITFLVFLVGLALDVFGQRRFAKKLKHLPKLFISAFP